MGDRGDQGPPGPQVRVVLTFFSISSRVRSNTSKLNLEKLLSVQNSACRIVLVLRKYDHISEGLKSHKKLSVKNKRLIYSV